MRSMKVLAREALDVQNACNLSGVAKSFANATSDLWDHARAEGHGTEWVNTHPVSVLYADKLASLTGGGDAITFNKAYDACDGWAKGKE